MPIQVVTKQFKIKVNNSLEATFFNYLGACRFVYNMAKELSDYSYKAYGKSFSKYDLQKQLPELKKEAVFLQEVNAQVLQNAIERYSRSMDNFFSGRAKYPKFANRKNWKSFTLPQRVEVRGDKLYLPCIGLVRTYEDLTTLNGNIKQATVIKKASGWYVSVMFEKEIEHLAPNGKEIGIDLGIKSLYITSDGYEAPNPNFLRKAEAKLKREQRSLSRKKKGSANFKRQAEKLAKLHEKVANCRKDYLHKETTKLIRDNQTLTIEDLKVANMIRNGKLSKSISDVGWGYFRQFLEYKSKWYGRELRVVNPRNTSKECSDCGALNEKLTLSVREWVCESCGSVHNRDVNAAININKRGRVASTKGAELRKNPAKGSSVETLKNTLF